MSQRESGYERKERDGYETPAWVTRALLPHLPACRTIWEPAAGSGKMSRVLEDFAGTVISSDIANGQDFLSAQGFDGDAIVTNPPYCPGNRVYRTCALANGFQRRCGHAAANRFRSPQVEATPVQPFGLQQEARAHKTD